MTPLWGQVMTQSNAGLIQT